MAGRAFGDSTIGAFDGRVVVPEFGVFGAVATRAGGVAGRAWAGSAGDGRFCAVVGRDSTFGGAAVVGSGGASMRGAGAGGATGAGAGDGAVAVRGGAACGAGDGLGNAGAVTAVGDGAGAVTAVVVVGVAVSPPTGMRTEVTRRGSSPPLAASGVPGGVW